MKTKRIFIRFLILSTIMLFACKASGDTKLRQSTIDELRKDYPITGQAPANITMIEPSLDLIYEASDSVLVLEITGDISHRVEDLLTGDATLDEKLASHGLPGEVEYFAYPVRVLQDEMEIYEEGTELMIYNNAIFEDVTPKLEAGDRISIPLQTGHNKSESIPFSVFGLYYITNDDYVLSAFNEKDGAFTGYHLERYLQEVSDYR